jgi:hypothetical protein
MPVLLEGFQKNTSLYDVNISWHEEHGKYWSSLLLYRNKFSRLLQDSDTYDRASLGFWSRALGSVATRPDVLFHALTSESGLICATPGEDSKKRKRDDSEYVVTYSISACVLTIIPAEAAHNSVRIFPPVISSTKTIHCYLHVPVGVVGGCTFEGDKENTLRCKCDYRT